MDTIITKKIFTKNSGIAKTDILEGKKCLHFGCGNSKLVGSIGVDILDLPAVDTVHDLDTYPWPFQDSSFDVLYGGNVVEHLSDTVAFMDEAARLLKKGGRLVVSVPYFRNIDAFCDPTHKKFFTSKSFDYFIKQDDSLSNYGYSKYKFEKIGFWYGWPHESTRLVVKWFKNFIYKHPAFYDQYLSLLFPMKIVVWELEVIK